MEKQEKKVAVLTKLLAGSLAGASETIVTFPAEYIKTRRQLPLNFSILSESRPPSMLSIIESTYNGQGLAGFNSGCGALAISNGLKSAIRFFSYSTTKEYLQKSELFQNTIADASQGSGVWINIIAGFSAGVTESLLVVTPGEVLKTRMVEEAASSTRNQYGRGSLINSATLLVKRDGITALWRGALPVLSKQSTNSAVRFASFGAMQEHVSKNWPSVNGKVGTTLAIGAASGVLTVYASMPFDTIKTQVQSSGADQRSGMFRCGRSIIQRSGIRGLWKGTTPRLVRLTLSSGITFAVYDQVVQTMALFSNPQAEFQMA